MLKPSFTHPKVLKLSMDNRVELFCNPPAAFRSKPFWAWNGMLEKEELLQQIHVMNEMGFGGFFMHSRTGLKTEYLGKEWFSLVDACAKEAHALGMEPWIYDEDRWPSGCAGGLVTRDSRYARKYLNLTIGHTPIIQENTVAVFRGKTEGLVISAGYEQVDPAIALSVELQGEEVFLSFCCHTMKPQNVYNGYSDLDRLSFEATQAFLQVTHEQYKRNCGESFHLLKGVFTDEPHRGMVFSDFSDPGTERKWSVPWTDDLAEEFKKSYGYDLISRLPELFLCYKGTPMAKIKWQYMVLLQKLFMQRFLLPISNWCHENELLLTGHLLNEDSLMSQVIPCGSLMQGYGSMDIPGIDSLTDNRFVPWAVKVLESSARQNGKQWKLTELYGATGWHMRFEDYKYIGDWQVILGSNVRCPHLSWYTMEGEAKRDYPGTFLHQATWYREYNRIETYFARLGVITTLGKPMCDTLVLHPAESLWCQIQPEWAEVLDGRLPWIQRLEKKFTQLFHWLMESHVDFDYGDEGILAEHASVVAKNGKCVLYVGQAAYSRVIVGGCVSIRHSTYALLEKFQACGGEIVFVGAEPSYLEGEYDLRCKALAEKCCTLPFRRKDLLGYFDRVRKIVCFLNETDGADIYIQTRKVEDGYFVILWNKDRKTNLRCVTIQLSESWDVENWDCFSGERTKLTTGAGTFQLSFAPGQEYVLYLTKESKLPIRINHEYTELHLTDRSVSYELDEPNVYVMDCADLWVDTVLFAQQQETLELDRQLRELLGMPQRGGDMIQPWASEKQKTPAHSIRLQYRVQMEVSVSAPIFLAMEQMEDAVVRVNGRDDVLKKTDIFWIDRCFHVYEISAGVLHKGENIIQISGMYTEASGLENVYLLGNFGVYFRNSVPVIGNAPRHIRIGNLVRQGFPFYGGKVTYHFTLPKGLGKTIMIGLPGMAGSCANIKYVEKMQMVPWKHRKTQWERKENSDQFSVQLVLHRRNTFGPLHRFPLKQPYTAPDSFVCTDIHRYALYPVGLLKPPSVSFIKE